MDVGRMYAALYETWKFYDEAGEGNGNYVLDPDNLQAFAADVCREYERTTCTNIPCEV